MSRLLGDNSVALPCLAYKCFAASVLEPLPPKVHIHSLRCQVMLCKAGSGLSPTPSRKHYYQYMDLGMERYSSSIAGTRNLLIPDPPQNSAQGNVICCNVRPCSLGEARGTAVTPTQGFQTKTTIVRGCSGLTPTSN